MKKSLAWLPISVIIAGCATQPQIKSTDLQNVALGDTMEMVTQRIGKPDQVVSNEVTGDGKHLVRWLYENVSRGAPGLESMQNRDVIESLEKEYQIKRLSNPPSIITFIDGKVAKIERQQ